MEIKISKEKDMPLLSRKRVSAIVEFAEKATPPSNTIRNELAKLLKVQPGLVHIKHVYTKYGQAQAKIIAHIYETKEDLVTLEKVAVEEPAEISKGEVKSKEKQDDQEKSKE